MVPEATFEQNEYGLMPVGKGWFVLNARDARWYDRGGRGHEMGVQGKADFAQIGVGLTVLGPGEPLAMYHWETDQEDFLILSGEALLVIEGQERPVAAVGRTTRTWLTPAIRNPSRCATATAGSPASSKRA